MIALLLFNFQRVKQTNVTAERCGHHHIAGQKISDIATITKGGANWEGTNISYDPCVSCMIKENVNILESYFSSYKDCNKLEVRQQKIN